MKTTDQFDEIQSASGLREECRSLLAQIKLHQQQIIELQKKLAEYNEVAAIMMAADDDSVDILPFDSDEEFVAWINQLPE